MWNQSNNVTASLDGGLPRFKSTASAKVLPQWHQRHVYDGEHKWPGNKKVWGHRLWIDLQRQGLQLFYLIKTNYTLKNYSLIFRTEARKKHSRSLKNFESVTTTRCSAYAMLMGPPKKTLALFKCWICEKYSDIVTYSDHWQWFFFLATDDASRIKDARWFVSWKKLVIFESTWPGFSRLDGAKDTSKREMRIIH